jgi:hypothetical protein
MRVRRGATTTLLLSGLSISAAAAALAAGCGSSGDGSTFTQPPDASTGDVGLDGRSLFYDSPPIDGNISYPDFPPNPILDAPDAGAAAPANSQGLFGPGTQGAQSGGPCLIEPEVGSLYPRNWLRPRFKWIAANGENLFELHVHAANQVNDLYVYTTQTEWTMPLDMWNGLRMHSNDRDMSVAVRGAVYANGAITGEALGSSGPLGIAPVDAPGSIVYWTTTGGSALKGFSVGDETVVPVLVPSQVQQETVSCVGCHTSTPDGKFASFCVPENSWSNALASVEAATVGQTPPWLGAGGTQALQQTYRGINTFSLGHFAQGDHVEIAGQAPGENQAELTWIDLEATTLAAATGTITRTGDSRHAGAPAWSHDGNTIVYVSTDATIDGRLDNGAADLYAVPYNNRAGGNATPVPGASDPNLEEYYPVFSPDDKWLAFDRIASNQNMYNNATAEVFVIPSAGGTAKRLDANDPPACTGKTSPGVTNSWPKFSPSASSASNGRTYYWLVFSSTRDPAANPQLYITGVLVDSTGAVTTYKALYLWNQPAAENNHTPAWDVFKIPPPPIH